MNSELKEYNRQLCAQYPWLLPRNRWTDKVVEDYDYSYTELDDLPEGWRIAFGEEICKEINDLLKKVNYENEYRILQIKEKYGSLRWYDDGVPKEISKDLYSVIAKYERISARTCINCGAPATKISTGYILPFCEECAKKYKANYVDINEELEEDENE